MSFTELFSISVKTACICLLGKGFECYLCCIPWNTIAAYKIGFQTLFWQQLDLKYPDMPDDIKIVMVRFNHKILFIKIVMW
ncbi:hypothetical protein Bca4012_085716 [Brassica carinata]